MRCPSCASLDTQVKDSRPTEDSAVIRRRRVCLTCNFRFTTFERVQLRELTVIKRNGRRVPFDRDKLMRSVQIALRKRAVEPERIEQMVSKIVRELESQGENEVSSETIGEARHGASARARRRRLCALCLRLPQFPRGQGLPRRARRIVGRRRAGARRPRANEHSLPMQARRDVRRRRCPLHGAWPSRSAGAGSAIPGPIRRSVRSSSRTT